MKILAIVSLGEKIGSGHFGRTLKLIEEINEKKNKTLFILNKKHKINITKNHFNYYFTNFNSQKKIINLISKFNPTLIILDSYILPYSLKKKIYRINKNILVIDDNLEKKHICKYYVNYNLLNAKLSKKIKQNVKSKKNFIGPSYFFLKKSENKNIKIKKKQVLIFLGSTNENNILEKTLSILKKKEFIKFSFKVILGNFSKTKTKNKTKKYNNFEFFKTMSHKKYLRTLAKSNYFISSGGVSVWEGLSLKKKLMVILTAKNQTNNVKNLKKSKIINYIGNAKNFEYKNKQKLFYKYFFKNVQNNLNKIKIGDKFKYLITELKKNEI